MGGANRYGWKYQLAAHHPYCNIKQSINATTNNNNVDASDVKTDVNQGWKTIFNIVEQIVIVPNKF